MRLTSKVYGFGFLLVILLGLGGWFLYKSRYPYGSPFDGWILIAMLSLLVFSPELLIVFGLGFSVALLTVLLRNRPVLTSRLTLIVSGLLVGGAIFLDGSFVFCRP
jgi:hypothetical protein